LVGLLVSNLQVLLALAPRWSAPNNNNNKNVSVYGPLVVGSGEVGYGTRSSPGCHLEPALELIEAVPVWWEEKRRIGVTQST
jgi:hypothetical protein